MHFEDEPSPSLPRMPLLLLLLTVTLAGFIWHYVNSRPPVAQCPVSTAWQIFVDPTGSNTEGGSSRANWDTEADKLAGAMGRCDLAVTRPIGAITAGTSAQYYAIPACDPHDPDLNDTQQYRCKSTIEAAKTSVSQALKALFGEASNDPTSDIIGALSAGILPGPDGIARTNSILVIFSDGKERLPDRDRAKPFYINLEDSGCDRSRGSQDRGQLIQNAVDASADMPNSMGFAAISAVIRRSSGSHLQLRASSVATTVMPLRNSGMAR